MRFGLVHSHKVFFSSIYFNASALTEILAYYVTACQAFLEGKQGCLVNDPNPTNFSAGLNLYRDLLDKKEQVMYDYR